ncbi:GRIP1-associated protein 1-like isoform X2 [Acropora muricata]|uniref:GRIP1-associated protein 1-like isoform X2 n=1 Tax=Acropora muricata TaxID=159855 RepID=UPI0034E4E169
MEGKHRAILRHYRPNIVKDLEPNNILPDLGSVLTAKDDAEIKAQSTRQGRCEQLLDIIPRKGPNAFKVFVEALKKEAPHLALDLIDADHKETDKELRQVREQNANLGRENYDLKNKLRTEEQDHTKTSREPKELKSLHESFETETSQQIRKLAEIVQQLVDDSCSPCKALRNLRDSTERETQTSEIRELTKGITKMIEGYQTFETQQRGYRSLQKQHGNLSQELKKAKKLLENKDKSKEAVLKLEKELEKSQRDLANKNERVKEYQQESQVKSKTIDDLRKKLKNTLEKKSLQKNLSQEAQSERSKCDTLKKEVHRLRLTSKQMLGQIYSYSGDFDTRGVVYDLVTNSRKTSHVNPSSSQIVASRSSDGEGKAEDILKNQVKRGTISGTEEKKGSWWRVDLTEKYALYLTHYTLRHGRNRSISVLVNWRLEGSINGRKWITLKNHKNDCKLKERPYCTYTWTIDGNINAFRYFRILQTGKNSSEKFGVFLSGIELYGVLITKSS